MAEASLPFELALSAMKSGAVMRRLEWRPNKWVHVKKPAEGLSYLEIVISDGKRAPYTPSRCDIFGLDWVDASSIMN